MDPIGHNDWPCDIRHNSSVAALQQPRLFCWSRNIWVIALFLMSSRAMLG